MQNTITVEEEDVDTNVELMLSIYLVRLKKRLILPTKLIGESANEGIDFVDSGRRSRHNCIQHHINSN